MEIILVTGGGRGIGKAITLGLANSDRKIFVNYSRSEKAAAEVCEEVVAKGGQAETVKFDVSKTEEVSQAVSEIISKEGKLDVVVNNAGIADDALIVRTSEEQWDKTLDINLKGAFNVCRAVSKSMMKKRYGRIINISSVIGEMGNAGQVAYSSSKAGMIGLTKSLARELASRGVTVNAITPGYIATDMTDDMTDAAKEAVSGQIPLGRLGEASDVASLVEFLASEQASYITGQIIGVNGGLYI